MTVRCPSVRLSVPRSIKNPGVFSSTTLNFISELGRRLCVHTGDARETSYLFQRISILIQLFNSNNSSNSFAAARAHAAGLRHVSVGARAQRRAGSVGAMIRGGGGSTQTCRLCVRLFVYFSFVLRAGFKGGAHWAVARGPPQKTVKELLPLET